MPNPNTKQRQKLSLNPNHLQTITNAGAATIGTLAGLGIADVGKTLLGKSITKAFSGSFTDMPTIRRPIGR